MARPSSPSRRCSSCGSASASSPRSRWSRRWCSSSSISRRCRASARSSPSSCRWRRSIGANERQVGRHIVFPGAVPAIFAGFRIAVPYAIGGAVIAELISSNRGLGYLVQTGAMNFDTTQVFVAILAATIIVHAFIAVVDVGRTLPAALAAARRRPHRRSRDLKHGRDADARDQGTRQALPGAAGGASRRPGSSRTCRSRSAPASLLTIVGPSGAGKSTLLNIIAQIDERERRRDHVRRRTDRGGRAEGAPSRAQPPRRLRDAG